jgi:hypothetical protein
MYILFISSQHPIIINNYYSPIAPWPSYKLRNMFHHLSSQEIEEIMKDCKNDEVCIKQSFLTFISFFLKKG